MLLKKPQNKKFEYLPRYYKPDEDKEEKRKKKLGFRKSRKALKRGRSTIYWLVLIIIILFIYLRFTGKI